MDNTTHLKSIAGGGQNEEVLMRAHLLRSLRYAAVHVIAQQNVVMCG
jgi:hypothetical protein